MRIVYREIITKFRSMVRSQPLPCLLLTATIDPGECCHLVRRDPAVREADYLGALQSWIEETNFPIVFCENSGYDLSRIRHLVARYPERRVELLQFRGNDQSKIRGKGYGELLIMEHALKHSRILRRSKYMVKVTGRLFISNLNDVIRGLDNGQGDFFVASFPHHQWLDKELIHSQCVIAKPGFVKQYLTKHKDDISDLAGYYLEHALYAAVQDAVKDGHVRATFRVMPLFRGYNATDNTPVLNRKFLYKEWTHPHHPRACSPHPSNSRTSPTR